MRVGYSLALFEFVGLSFGGPFQLADKLPIFHLTPHVGVLCDDLGPMLGLRRAILILLLVNPHPCICTPFASCFYFIIYVIISFSFIFY